MPLWMTLKELFSFQPTGQNSASTLLSEIYRDFNLNSSDEEMRSDWDTIKFDNSFRLGISVVALGTAFVLWGGKFISSIWPPVALFVGYILIQTALTWGYRRGKSHRPFAYLLSGVDLFSLTFAVYWTGGSTSPLYFIFFIPLIIQAFHRDWNLLLFYGVGGLVLYSVLILASMPNWQAATLVSMGSRLFFMGLTVGIALFAVNLLRNKELMEKRRLSRLKCMVNTTHILNGVCLLKDLPSAAEKCLTVLNSELEQSTQSWSQFFLRQGEESIMRAIQDPRHLREELNQSLLTKNCPAIVANASFQICESKDGQPGCPVESFSMFSSHICVPIRGEMGEMFGILFTGREGDNVPEDEDIRFLQFIATTLGLTIHRLKRMEELNLAFEMDNCAMASFIGSTRCLDDAYAAITDGIRTILNADQVGILLWNPEGAKLEPRYVWGTQQAEAKRLNFLMGEGLPGRTYETGRPLWTYDHTQQLMDSEGISFKGLLCVPLFSPRRGSLGVLTASTLNPQRTFSIEEIDLVSTFCTRAAVAIENALLHQQQRDQNSAIESQTDNSNQRAA